jgi:hypothetical protein
MNDKKIGKKIWVLKDEGYKCVIDKTKELTIVSIISYKDAKDICNHIVARDEQGNETELREWNAIFTPNPELKGDQQISRYLSDNECYVDGVYTNRLKVIEVEITWGDLKHEHLWCRDLMGYLGYIEIGNRVTEENGSDCYYALHYFMKNQ